MIHCLVHRLSNKLNCMGAAVIGLYAIMICKYINRYIKNSLNKDPDYKRDSSSPSLSRNASFNVFNKDGGQCEDKGKKPLGNN